MKEKTYRVKHGKESVKVKATSQKDALKKVMDEKGWKSGVSCMQVKEGMK